MQQTLHILLRSIHGMYQLVARSSQHSRNELKEKPQAAVIVYPDTASMSERICLRFRFLSIRLGEGISAFQISQHIQ